LCPSVSACLRIPAWQEFANDCAVEQTSLIDGNPLLAEAATNAVKQWKYKPLLVGGKPVLKFVVVLCFGKRGKVRAI
jgi:hypothetical protein